MEINFLQESFSFHFTHQFPFSMGTRSRITVLLVLLWKYFGKLMIHDLKRGLMTKYFRTALDWEIYTKSKIGCKNVGYEVYLGISGMLNLNIWEHILRENSRLTTYYVKPWINKIYLGFLSFCSWRNTRTSGFVLIVFQLHQL